MEELFIKLIEQAESMSPAIWGIFLKQVRSDTVVIFALATVLLGCFIFFLFAVINAKKEGIDEFSPIAMVLISGLSSFGMFAWAIQMLINPEYFAIKLLIEQIK